MGSLLIILLQFLKNKLGGVHLLLNIYPEKFIDQQLKGPYSLWHHTHYFYNHGNYVEMIDKVSYAIPFGFIGRMINYFFINKDLLERFDYRKKNINNYFKENNNI